MACGSTRLPRPADLFFLTTGCSCRSGVTPGKVEGPRNTPEPSADREPPIHLPRNVRSAAALRKNRPSGGVQWTRPCLPQLDGVP